MDDKRESREIGKGETRRGRSEEEKGKGTREGSRL